MKPKWHFNLRRPCDRLRDSANDAFFTAESLENLSEALVREAIQNSLDAAARAGGVRQVRMNIRLVPNAPEGAWQFLNEQFAAAQQHFERGLAQRTLDPLLGEDTGYLLMEDFGTMGLTGDINECRLDHVEQNAFFSFFRAEGQSAKTGENLGRWGIGKQVFPAASRLHAMFGLTVRGDTPSRLLMGSAVLRTHSLGEQDYQPDAWFGCRDTDERPVAPITDPLFIDSFASTFGLTRGNLPGLSILVPSVDERVREDDIRRGIARNFFWPILLGELVVGLEAPSGPWQIDHETLATHRTLLPPSEAAVIEFAAWASTAKPAETVCLPNEGVSRPDWRASGDQLLPPVKLDEIRERLANQKRVAIRVPVRVRPKEEGRQESMSFFTVYILPCRDPGHRPIFLRDGIVISDVRCPQMSGYRALVEVEDPPLAGLLGDAEGVNHTQWQKDSPKFHNRYVWGTETIKFVTRSVYEIMQRLHAAEIKGDPTLLLGTFYLPAEEGPVESAEKPKDKPPGEVVEPSPALPPPPPRRFDLQSVKGGFLLRPGKAAFDRLPVRLRVEAGYAVRRGNAIKRWAPDDFTFIRPPLRQDQANGVHITREHGNVLELEIRKVDFQFGVSGFDTKRDLVVRAVEVKEEHETDV